MGPRGLWARRDSLDPGGHLEKGSRDRRVSLVLRVSQVPEVLLDMDYRGTREAEDPGARKAPKECEVMLESQVLKDPRVYQDQRESLVSLERR